MTKIILVSIVILILLGACVSPVSTNTHPTPPYPQPTSTPKPVDWGCLDPVKSLTNPICDMYDGGYGYGWHSGGYGWGLH